MTEAPFRPFMRHHRVYPLWLDFYLAAASKISFKLLTAMAALGPWSV